ncbi:MAG: hypothetical protein IJ991_03205 [Thermoguttaceae bacterium]|nr:hypothetical protein [Thermoguttaceae bacterium]
MDPSTVKDFTPNELNRRLEEMYAEIAFLAGALAHEVKNPLSTIRLNMELLAEDVEELEDSPQRRRALKRVETARRETTRLEDLLNEFLNFTRAHRLELSPADPNRELKEIVEFFDRKRTRSASKFWNFIRATRRRFASTNVRSTARF